MRTVFSGARGRIQDHQGGSYHVTPEALRRLCGEVELLLTDEVIQRAISTHGVAYRVVDGISQMAVALSFAPDLPRARQHEIRCQLPREVLGFPVVFEHGMICRVWGFRKSRPRGGSAIRARDSYIQGTLGCFVERDGQTFGLTCEHVLGTRAKVGLEVEWPRKSFRRDEEWTEFGTIHDLGGLVRNGGVSPTDSALLALAPGLRASQTSLIAHPSADPLDPYEAVATKAAIHKIGGGTGHTIGRVTGLLNIAVLQHHPTGPPSVFRHNDVFEIHGEDRRWCFCDRGDSGAMIWERDRRPRPVGLLIATRLLYKGFAIPAQTVLHHHGVTVAGASK